MANNREDDPIRRMVQSRDLNARDIPDREDQSILSRGIEDKADISIFTTVAKVAATGFAVYALGKSTPKNVWVEALHRVGKVGGATFGRMKRKFDQTIEDQLVKKFGHGFGYGRNVNRSVALADVIEHELGPMVYNDLHGYAATRTAKNSVNSAIRRTLEEKFGGAGLAGRGDALTGVTVADILGTTANQRTQFNVISETAYSNIKGMRNKLDPTGKWFDKLVVDKHLNFKGGMKSFGSDSLRDTRWISRSSIGDALNNSLGFTIPGVGFRPLDLFTPFARLLGMAERRTFGVLGNNAPLKAGMKSPKLGLNLFVGGEIHNVSTLGGHQLVGSGFNALNIDRMAVANLSRLGEHPAQQLSTTPTFWDSVQNLLGIGTKYRTQASGFSRIVQASRNAQQLRQGNIAWDPYETVKASSLGFGGRLERQMASGSRYHLDDVASPMADRSFQELSWLERTKALFGFSRHGRFEQGGRTYTGAGAPFNTSSVSYGRHKYGTVGSKGPNTLLELAKEDASAGIYAIESGWKTNLSLIGHHMTGRLNDLFGVTLGVGFRPGAGNMGLITNALKIAGIGKAVSWGLEGLKYTDYLTGHLGSGALLGGYQATTLGMAGIKDVTGVTSGAKYAEDLLPGITTSPITGAARIAGPMYAAQRFMGPKGLAAGFVGSMLLGGPSDLFGIDNFGAKLTTSASDLAAMYSGEKDVRIKSSRWWMMNRQGFQGEGTDRYEKHWVAKAKSNWQYTSTLYGSESEYWKHASSLPTPHNLFGLGDDEDYYAKKHYRSRPYPFTSSGEQMHVGEDLPPGRSRLPGDLSASELQLLGYSGGARKRVDAHNPGDLDIAFKRGFSNVNEFAGIYKFLGEMAFGRMQTGPIYGDAGNITSPNRQYWDKDMGGLFGMTELLRRFIVVPNELGASQIVNDIPNQMPGFLPGRRSMSEGDRDYHIDFTTGDPYSKIKGGEYRLPGAAYEAMHRLHSGTPGVYDAMDMFLILSDVAPHSQSYQHYKTIVEGWAAGGALDKHWQEKFAEGTRRRDEMSLGYAADFAQRKFTNEGETKHRQDLSAINAAIRGGSEPEPDVLERANRYNSLERVVGGIWERATLDHLPDSAELVPFGPSLFHKAWGIRTAERDYYERQVLNASFSDWHNPYKGFIEPRINRMANSNPASAGVQGALFALTATNPLSMVGRGIVGAGAGLMSSSARVASGTPQGGYVPGYRRKEEEYLQYMDMLEYQRYGRAAQTAVSMGQTDIANKFRRLQSTKTMVGLDYNDPNLAKTALGAVPRNEKNYIRAFSQMKGPEGQATVMNMVPGYMKDIYKSTWDPGTVHRDPEQIANNYFRNNVQPSSDWAGWDPSVPKWQIMARTVDTPGNGVAADLHRQHISNMMMRQAKAQVPNVGLQSVARNFMGSYAAEAQAWLATAATSHDMYDQATRAGMQNVRISPSMDTGYNNAQINYNFKNNSNLRQNMAIAEVYR